MGPEGEGRRQKKQRAKKREVSLLREHLPQINVV
jgi:hypothetical protein